MAMGEIKNKPDKERISPSVMSPKEDESERFQKLDPFLMKAVVIRVEHKTIQSEYYHRKKYEASVNSFHKRYAHLFGDESLDVDSADLIEDQRLDETSKDMTVDEAKDKKEKKRSQLSIRISSLKDKITELKNRGKMPNRDLNDQPEESPSESASPTIDSERALVSGVACLRWKVAMGLIMGLAKMSAQAMEQKKEFFSAGELTFDPTLFKACNKDIRLSADSKFILTLTSDRRSEKQIEDVINNIKKMNMKSFNDYPLNIQRKLVRIARYEVLTPHRIIVRQGRPAENFFFLLYGTVVALERVLATDKSLDRENLVILRKGTLFGETEMANNLFRRATIITKGNVELLTIERTEMIQSFVQRSKPTEIPDHIKFLMGCEFMNLWPVDKLGDNFDHCAPYFFKSNSLVVDDNLRTDYLVIIRSGQCRVICKIVKDFSKDPVNPALKKTEMKMKLVEYQNNLLRANFRHFSRRGSQLESLYKGKSFSSFMNSEYLADKMLDERRDDKVGSNQWEEEKPKMLRRPTKIKKKGSLIADQNKEHDVSTKTVSRTLMKRLTHHRSSAVRDLTRELSALYLNRLCDPEDRKRVYGLMDKSNKTSLEKALLLPPSEEVYLEQMAKEVQPDKIPIYIQLDTLKTNDVFGLDTLVFDKYYDSPSNKKLCLVSSDDEAGVDVVFLSKSFFIANATEQVAWRVRRIMKSYPDPEMILKEMEGQELWSDYKKDFVKDFFKSIPS